MNIVVAGRFGEAQDNDARGSRDDQRRISLLIVLGDLAFRVRKTGYVWGGKVWIEVYDADSLKSMNRTRVCCKTQARTNTAAKAIIKAINKEIELQTTYERCR